MKKKMYVAPEVEVFLMEPEDMIAGSGADSGGFGAGESNDDFSKKKEFGSRNKIWED